MLKDVKFPNELIANIQFDEPKILEALGIDSDDYYIKFRVVHSRQVVVNLKSRLNYHNQRAIDIIRGDSERTYVETSSFKDGIAPVHDDWIVDTIRQNDNEYCAVLYAPMNPKGFSVRMINTKYNDKGSSHFDFMTNLILKYEKAGYRVLNL